MPQIIIGGGIGILLGVLSVNFMKEMLNKWIQMNAEYFNNKGCFSKLYPEFSKLL